MILEKDVELLLNIFGDESKIIVKGIVISSVDKAPSVTCPASEGVPEGRGRNSDDQEENSSLCLSRSSFKRRQAPSDVDDVFNPFISNKLISFLYIQNPDKTIRWIIPEDQNKPYFLHLYNGSSWRGFLINNFYKIGFKLGLKKWICNGSFEVVGGVGMPSDNYAIFTGTKGENRKVIITSGSPNRPNGYLKIPLTEKAKRLTRTEGNVLNEMNNFNFKTLEIPKTKFEKGGVWVSNVQPQNFKNETEIGVPHLNALMELFDKTEQLQKLSDLPTWTEIQSDLNGLSTSNIKNDLSPSKVQKLIGMLLKLRNQFSDSDLLPTYQAHGDFTPWNMFLSEENLKLHLFDWELSERLPALYDLFHFAFQTGVLVKKHSYVEIKSTIDNFLQQTDFQYFMKENNIDLQQVYSFYLLRNCSYYLKRYIAQKDLHEQAHWLLDCWLEALETLMKRDITLKL